MVSETGLIASHPTRRIGIEKSLVLAPLGRVRLGPHLAQNNESRATARALTTDTLTAKAA